MNRNELMPTQAEFKKIRNFASDKKGVYPMPIPDAWEPGRLLSGIWILYMERAASTALTLFCILTSTPPTEPDGYGRLKYEENL